MAIHLKNVTIPRRPLGGPDWQLNDLRSLTVILGKNGSGKSLLLRSWRDKSPSNTHYIGPERTGKFDFQPQMVQEEGNASSRQKASRVNWIPNYHQRAIGRIHSYFLARGSVRGDQTFRGYPDELEKMLHSLILDFEVVLKGTLPPYELLRLPERHSVTEVEQLSSGEAQLFTIGLDVLMIAAIWEIENCNQRILLIDEPDAHIHPDLQIRLADFLLQISRRFKVQIVVATHSTSLLAALGQFGGNDAGVVYLKKESSNFKSQPFESIQKKLAACLGGHVLMGPLFGAPLLLVEGDDDYRIWSQVPRHHMVLFSVLPTNGDEIKKYQRSLEQILGCLQSRKDEPLGYALLDGDKTLPQPNPDNPQEFIRYVRLECHEAENLYLTDEVLAYMGCTWEEAIAKLLEKSNNFGNKAEFLRGAVDWDRQKVDLKGYIKEISQIIDPKNINWTERVGAVIGKARPTGQLGSFLGESVVNALWGSALVQAGVNNGVPSG